MNKVETLKIIVQIQRLEMEIFEEEDGYPVDYRIVKNKEKAINNRLDKLTNDNELKQKIRRCIQHNMWNMNDITFIPICVELRKLGLEV